MRREPVLSDKHKAFGLAVAGGMEQWKAYQTYISAKAALKTCQVNSSLIMAKPEMKAFVAEARKQRETALIKANANALPPELTGVALTLDQMDAFHYSVAKGLVEVEEVIPVQNTTEDIDPNSGKVKRRTKTVSFMRVKRKPNIRERQTSISELYKRLGSYAPSKLLGAFGKVQDDEGEDANVQRFVILSNGEKIPF